MSIPDLCPHGPDPGEHPPTRLVNPTRLALRVLHVGSEPVSHVWDGLALVNPYWRAYIVDRPGVALRHAGGDLAYPVDRITVIPAWCRFGFQGADDVGHAFIHFAVPALPRAIVRRAWPAPFHLDDRDLLARLRILGRQLGFGPPPPEIGTAAQALAGLVLQGCLERLDVDERQRCLQPRHQRLAPALDHIDARLADPIPVADLARRLAVSEEHCIRLFRRHLGQTPAQYIIDRRLLRAAELLAEPAASIPAVATACGFPNRQYFTRVFTKRLGLTPGAYRDR